jgi:hypothetical protein
MIIKQQCITMNCIVISNSKPALHPDHYDRIVCYLIAISLTLDLRITTPVAVSVTVS